MRWLLAVTALGLAAGCSHKDDALANKVSTVSGFCNEWATRACNDNVVKHCAAATTEDCMNSQQAFCEMLVPQDEYSSKTAIDCLNAVQSAYQQDSLDASQRDTVLHLGNECSKILSGDRTAGKSCTVDSDCNRDEGLACVMKGTAGKCEMPSSPPIMGGYSCEADEAVCADGFYCDGKDCLAEKSEGDDCSAAVPCDAKSHCLDKNGNLIGPGGTADGGAASGTCAARKTMGAECASDDDCTSLICAISSGSTKGVCAAQVSFGPSEEICKNLR
jgi:hypothetical protein